MGEQQKHNGSRVGEELLAFVQNVLLAALLVFAGLFVLRIFTISATSWTPVVIAIIGLTVGLHFVVGMYRPWID